jgi:hypothetical protein
VGNTPAGEKIMTPSKPPLVLRIAAALLIIAAGFGQWWQHQPAGPTGRALLAAIAWACPSAAVSTSRPIIAETAHAFDRAGFARLGNLLFRDGRDRCRTREVSR